MNSNTSESELDLDLLIACAKADYDETERLLRDGANPDFDHEGVTPLMFAAGNEDFELVALLLHHGAVVTDLLIDQVRRHGYTEMVGLLESGKRAQLRRKETQQAQHALHHRAKAAALAAAHSSPVRSKGDDSRSRKDMCFDFTAFDWTKITEWMAESPTDHIAIFQPSVGTAEPQAVCYGRSILRNMLHDPTKVFYPCVYGQEPERHVRLVAVALQNYTVYVPQESLERALSSHDSTFSLLPLRDGTTGHQVEYKSTISVGADTGSHVSAHHCGPGTEKLVHDLVPMRARQSSSPPRSPRLPNRHRPARNYMNSIFPRHSLGRKRKNKSKSRNST